MAGLSRRRLHRAPRNLPIPGGGLQPFRLTLTTSTPTIAEGADAVWSIALDTRGYTRQSGDPPIVFYMRVPSDTTAQGGDWTITQAALFATANAVTGVTQTVVGSAYQFSLAYNFVGPIPLTRPSKDDEVTEAEKFTALIIENATVGSPHAVEIVEPSRVEVILTDEGGPAPPPTLSLATSSLLEGAANSTVVGLLSSSAGGTPTFTLTHVDGVAIDGTDRFKIASLNSLQAGTVATDYETASNHTVTVTSSDGGSRVFNITVINDASDDPVIEYASTPAIDGWYVTVGAPGGFVIGTPTVTGTITGRAITDVGTYRYISYINAISAQALGGPNYNDLRNLFQISGANLIVAPAHTLTNGDPASTNGVLDFFGGTRQGGPGLMSGCGWYKVTIRFTFSSGPTQDVVYRVRPAYTPVTPVDSSGFTDAPIAAVGEFGPAIANTTPNRKIRVPAAVIGVAGSGSTTVFVGGHHLLIEGHNRFIGPKNNKVTLNGNNLHVKDCQFLPGIGMPGTSYEGRDPLEIQNGYNIYVENCTVGWGTDDIGIGSSTPKQIRRIHFYRCLFAEPSWAPVHDQDTPTEIRHPYGPRHSLWLTQIEMVKCAIIGHKARSPEIGVGNFGYLLQNNIIAMHHNSGPGATSFVGAQTPPRGNTVISRDNLYLNYNRPYQQNSWTALEEVYSANKVITAPSPGGATADLPVLNTDGLPGQGADDYPAVHTVLQNQNGTASTAVFRTYLPFLPPSSAHYTSMPIITEANRNALIADNLDYVGCRMRDGSGNPLPGDANASEITRRILSNFRAKTTSGIYTFGISTIEDPIDTCAVGAGGDACRAVGGYVTGA